MNKLDKKDGIYLFLIIFSFLGMVIYLSGTKYLYGSQLDWYAQHVPFPEYFRTLFYETSVFFPDFAFNIGSGQNIYNFSYYGLLSPIILISYLFPDVKMVYYLIAATVLAMIAGAILFYVFLKNRKIRSEVCFLSVLIFILAAPITFHSHRHIMFIIYMPFLILGLYGVEKKLNQGKGWLLSLSVFLIIMTNYYYSVGAILALIIYAVYIFLKKKENFKWKEFFAFLLDLSIPFIIAILSSCILVLPTFATLIYNRGESNASVSLWDVLVPNLKFSNLLYEPYGIGLNVIAIPAIVSTFKKKKENVFLGAVLVFLAVFNCFSYFLNGAMYIDSKVLIPFLPLYIIAIAGFLEDTFQHKNNLKNIFIASSIVFVSAAISGYKVLVLAADMIVTISALILYRRYKKVLMLILPIALFTIASAYNTNRVDELVVKEKSMTQYDSIKESIDYITEKDNDYYRISNDINISNTPNTVYENINYLNVTAYSSLSNQTYNKFYYDVLNNNMPSRNRAVMSAADNLMSLILMGNKYIVSEGSPLLGYTEVGEKDGIKIYENHDVYPLGFASSDIMDYDVFEKLSDFEKQEALLKYIIAETDEECRFYPEIQKIDLDFGDIFKGADVSKAKDGSYTIETKKTLKINYSFPKKYKNKIAFVRFKMNRIYSEKELTVSVNNIKNKLTESTWRYYNGNEIFDYVIAEKKLSGLNFEFKEGIYNISDFEMYLLDYASIENGSDKVDRFVIDRDNTKGDKISGSIKVNKSGYFLIQIPYDDGFTIKVDGKAVKHEKLDDVYIGCKIEEGMHKIEIEYEAPLKNVSLIVSLFGIVCFISMTLIEKIRYKKIHGYITAH